ncbi:MAG TPA: hypothetical protein VHJ20_04030, partial [Polyangia bacterium]|nr:hypothetical protein [Polyangia bacterium]
MKGFVWVLALALAAPTPARAASAAAAKVRARGADARTGRAYPPVAELVKAARKNDRATMERLAARLGVARLGEAARDPSAATAQAALAA